MKGQNQAKLKRYCSLVYGRIKQGLKPSYRKKVSQYRLCFSKYVDVGKNVMGRVSYERKRIYINPVLLNERNIDILIETLKHEIAHVLAVVRYGEKKGAGHGKYFKRACSYLNISQLATANYTIRYKKGKMEVE